MQPLPLEPICVYVGQGKEKITSDTGERIRFHGRPQAGYGDIFTETDSSTVSLRSSGLE